MSYVPPFDIIRNMTNIVASKGALRVSISYEEFIHIIQLYLVGVVVDEEWYLTRYPDVAESVRSGQVASARTHFVEHGYIEGRLHRPIIVDEQWYLEQYPDVAESVRRGDLASAQSHFDRDGYREGRLPFPM